MKKLLPLVLMFVLAACGNDTATQAPTPPESDRNREEITVYAALLQARYGNLPLVLADQTGTGPADISDMDNTLEYIMGEMSAVSTQTVDGFRTRNSTPIALDPQMDIGMIFSLLSEADMRAMFAENQNGWDVFYSRYPAAPGIISLSRVGFNDSLDQALIYIGIQSHWLAGAGYYLLLEKVNGTWVEIQEVLSWIS